MGDARKINGYDAAVLRVLVVATPYLAFAGFTAWSGSLVLDELAMRRAAAWKPTTARVTSVHAETTTYLRRWGLVSRTNHDVRYEYTWDGQTYTGTRWRIDGEAPDDDVAQRLFAGRTIDILVDPGCPADACAELLPPDDRRTRLLATGAGACIAACVIALRFRKPRRRDERGA